MNTDSMTKKEKLIKIREDLKDPQKRRDIMIDAIQYCCKAEGVTLSFEQAEKDFNDNPEKLTNIMIGIVDRMLKELHDGIRKND